MQISNLWLTTQIMVLCCIIQIWKVAQAGWPIDSTQTLNDNHMEVLSRISAQNTVLLSPALLSLDNTKDLHRIPWSATSFGNGLEMVQQLNSRHSLITGTNYLFFTPNQVQGAHLLECQLAYYHIKSCERHVRTTAEGSLRSSKPTPCMWSLGKAWSPPSSIVGQRHPYQEAAASQGPRVRRIIDLIFQRQNQFVII